MRNAKRAAALEIPYEVKVAVSERDSFDGWPCCLLCGRPAPGRIDWSCCHVISRAQGGLGIEQNVVTLCPDCHRRLDQSEERDELREELAVYLKQRYKNWSKQKCVWRYYAQQNRTDGAADG